MENTVLRESNKVLEGYKTDLLGLSAQSSELTGSLKGKLKEHQELSTGIRKLREEISIGKQTRMLDLSKMDKEELKEFGSNADIRNAKIDSEFAIQQETIKIFENSLRSIDHEIEFIKIDMKHISFEKDVLMTILMS